MRRSLLVVFILTGFYWNGITQNVFNPADPIIRYDKNQPVGSPQHPDTSRPGLQKFVSTPTIGVSLGTAGTTFDASSFKQYFINFNGVKMAFRMKFPRSYSNPDSANKKYPVMLFLHGGGEVGCSSNGGIFNNEKPLWIGGKRFRDHVDANRFDGFLLYPQMVITDGCFAGWLTTPISTFTSIIAMVDSMSKYVRADEDRLVIDGLSGGGYGAWRMAESFPQHVAKIIPSAAAGSTVNRGNFVHIPIWFATGGKDPDPSPASAQYALTRMQELGADIRYTLFPELGHSVWNDHWDLPDFIPYLNDVHKANPLVFFQHNEFCFNEAINARLGITQGFYAYEWSKDGVLIATRTNGVNTIIEPSVINDFTGNEISVKEFGTYRVRFKRSAGAEWSDWSHKPAVVKLKTGTQTPPITVNGARSKVLPALDGSDTVPLKLPPGFLKYQWYHVSASDTTLMDTLQIFNASVGSYVARYAEQFGCGTSYSPVFHVIDANGSPKPDPASNLTSSAVSETAVKLNWSQAASPASNETGFEVYRGTSAGGPYKFVALTAANVVTYQDTGLVANVTYFYKIRAVNETGASAGSNESPVKTQGDNSPPTAPSNLQYRGSTQSTVSLRWKASTDNDDISRYDIYANGVKLFSTTSTEYTAISLDSLKTYAFTVKAIDNAGNTSAPSNQVTGYTHRQGLNYKYFNGTWTALPDYTALTADKSGIVDTVSINSGIRTQANGYGFLWESYIYIPESATYTFETYSDDGSAIYVDTPYTAVSTPLVINDSVHGPRSRTGSIALTQGYHHIFIPYFQNSSGSDMQLYWSDNAGISRERIPKNFFSIANVNLGTPPAIPGSPTADAIAYNKIRLGWSDNSNNETGFEVVRSLTADGEFVPVGTASANASSFTDSGLTALKTYYYKIRAIAAGTASAFTDVVMAVTPIAPLTPAAPSQLVGQPGSNNAISLSWNDNSSDETSFVVYRSTDNVNWSVIATLPANTNAYTDETATPLTNYYYYVAGANLLGTGESSNVVQVSSGNTAPVIGTIEDISVKTDATATVNFSVTDDPSDQITVTLVNGPSFITLHHGSGSTYTLTAAPGAGNAGSYTVTVTATDNKGKTSTTIINVFVADKSTRAVFINFGSSGKTAPAPWNNWLGLRAAGDATTALKDESNAATNFVVTTVNAWSGLTNLGHITGDNSGLFPDAVLQSGIADSGTAKQIKISGLDPAMQYNLVFAGSQNEGVFATSQYATGTQSSVLNARYNTHESANLNNLVPDANGELLVTITRTGATPVSFLNGMVIEEYAPSVTMLNPANLYVEAVNRNVVSVSWSDRTNNESATGGYELKRANDSLFTQGVTTIALDANVTEYTNTGLTPNTQYWYRVRAKNANGYSGYSNSAQAVTPASIVYVNFNTTVADAPDPWNSLASAPLSNFTTPNLKDQDGATTPITMTLEKLFNGEFTAGVNTRNNSGVVPDNVLMANYWLDNQQLGQFSVSGLNHTRKYRIGFIGSSSPEGWFKGNYTSTYTVNGKTVYLNSWQNSSKIVYVGDVSPDESGKLLLNFSTTADAGYGFNSGVVIEEYTEGGAFIPTDTIPDNPDPGNPDPGNPDPGNPDPGNPDPGNPDPGNPDPGNPDPGNPDPGNPDPGNPDPIDTASTVVLYPNPFFSAINVKFNNTSADNIIMVDIYDLNGRLIYQRNFGKLPAGPNTLNMNTLEGNMRGTMYFFALRVNGKVENTIKIIHKNR